MRWRILGVVLVMGLVTPTSALASPDASGPAVGLFDPATADWYLRDVRGGTTSLTFGEPGDQPLVGDWDGDGWDELGYYRPSDGTLVLQGERRGAPVTHRPADALPLIPADEPPAFAMRIRPGAVAVAGDFDGDGIDEVTLCIGDRWYPADVTGLAQSGLGPDPLPVLLPEGMRSVAAMNRSGGDELMVVAHSTVTFLHTGSTAVIGPYAQIAAVDLDAEGREELVLFEPYDAEIITRDFFGDDLAISYGSTGMTLVAGRFEHLPGADEAPPHVVLLPDLQQGDLGEHVLRLQELLAEKGFYRGPLDGDFGGMTSYAVLAFHKAAGLRWEWSFRGGQTETLRTFTPWDLPDRNEPDRVEVDLGRQLLYVILDGRVQAMIPVSTGNGELYESHDGAIVPAHTPRGNFRFRRHIDGWETNYLGSLYESWYFTPAYAVHGSGYVPAGPASHGCVRVTTFDADWLEGPLYIGMPVHVWD